MGNILPSPQTWISGDLHLENFGSYKGDNRLVYFDINDFDEAILAPASWELVRLVTSIFIAFQTLKINQKKALHMASLFLKSYAKTLALGKQNYIEPQTASGIVYDFLSTVSKRKRKRILKKRTIKNKKGLLILKKHPKHFPIEEPLKTELSNHINNWLHFDGNSPYNYQVIDATFRVAGTGSLGLNRYVLLLKSINNVGEKYLLIDMKEAIQSSLQPYIQIQQPEWPLQAERIRSVQYIMQNRAPALLSTSVFRNKSYLIQEMQPEK